MTLIHWNYTAEELGLIALGFVLLFVAGIVTIQWIQEMFDNDR